MIMAKILFPLLFALIGSNLGAIIGLRNIIYTCKDNQYDKNITITYSIVNSVIMTFVCLLTFFKFKPDKPNKQYIDYFKLLLVFIFSLVTGTFYGYASLFTNNRNKFNAVLGLFVVITILSLINVILSDENKTVSQIISFLMGLLMFITGWILLSVKGDIQNNDNIDQNAKNGYTALIIMCIVFGFLCIMYFILGYFKKQNLKESREISRD